MKKTEGLVVKRQNVLESDKLITIMTKDFGKIKAIARSARKIKSKLAGHLEPMSVVDLHLVDGKNFAIITSARVKEIFSIDKTNLKMLSYAYLMLEMADKLTAIEEKNEGVYNLLVECLSSIGSAKNMQLVCNYYLLKLLCLTGHEPDLSADKRYNKYFFDFANGGLVDTANKSSRKVSKDIIKLWRLISKHNLGQIKKVIVNPDLLSDSERLFEEFYSYQFGVNFKSTSILK